jgi:hypothetical protein
VRVWFDAWQWQCCGEPFDVGSEVEWRLNPVSADARSFFAERLGDAIAASITHSENHHSGAPVAPVPTRGRVESITAVYWRVAESADRDPRNPQALWPVVGSARLEDAACGGNSRKAADEHFPGYIVDLTPLGT